ncbi:na+/H+ antiporter NhaC [[Clostridium] bifermentans ATCC 638]|uniref:Na+/H+ antiporter NhaC n=1 Tax=Paraclostridium bifermentans ATCC 638 = DSM 14991 TaxID=1233171 RepID=T4VKF2_PARBF|nr:Na+/H+ antiporter NhaC [Paraclostridium bifermentans]EQK41256.1 na+/H+ antiporter NhaC [[Clostridium] bifermentans ATCC 638] [Paraclostridium bifermentans ATCC 638 = DSM 14991]RIZ58949.1 Na+/H+ antiporter NhaC [Paraclostridium bifermentans]UAG18531.1 Na+/H+ antiporter NhaC [Paraclostridium bifermentans]
MSKNIEKRKPTFQFAVLVMVAIISLTTVGMVVFKASITTMFLLSWLIVVPAAMKLGYTNSEIEEMGFDVGKGAFQSNIIVLSVGVLIATWIAAGTIPTIVYSGLAIITPKYFLVTTLVVCSLTSIATGTSWGTLGTSGIALMSIGTSMGVPAGLTAGAIISGAFFGDKISPLSDSTNLSAAVCKTDVITHIKHMTLSAVPAYIICVVLYTVIGFKYANNTIDYNQINQVMEVLKANFNIGFVSIIPIIFLLILLLLQKPSIVSILASGVAGAIIAFFQEGESVSKLLNYMLNGFSIDTGLEYTDKLLNRGGIMSMAETVLLVFIVFVIAGILQKAGFLEVLLQPMLSKIGKSRTKLIGTTFISSYLANAFSSSMMFTSVFVGTIMEPLYKEFNLKPENLSRIIQDTATLGAPLIPWNSNAIFCSQTLGVSSFEFIPYCFLNWITPLITFIYGVTGFTMKTYTEEEVVMMREVEEVI